MEKKKQGGDKPKKHGDYSKFYKKPAPGAKKRSAAGRKKDDPGKVREGGYRRKDEGLIRLNKYLADAGICSRREADKLISSGAVKVNGKVVTELGTKVSTTDKVVYGGQALRREKLRYLVLNKPKDFITTTDDPFERKTVMSLVEKACPERIYPVGRLDRGTTGVLLFTNDGDIAKKLTHPKHGIRKIYHVVLNKQLTKADYEKISTGLELDDGFIKADKISWIEEGKIKKEVGLELHSGRNRIVRRIFESLGYRVVRLDRVVFAGITKKDTPRGKWRMLTDAEVNMLKRLPK
jgi:23S rRNA pseudouridine2605 synthase